MKMMGIKKQITTTLLSIFVLCVILNLCFIFTNAEKNKTIHIPVRWCAIIGSPAVTSPHFPNPYGKIDNTTESILDTRLQMINDNIYNPIGISFYSLHHNLSKPNDRIPIIQDPNTGVGKVGNQSISNQMEGGEMIESCDNAWKDTLHTENLPGIVVINIRLFVNANGNSIDTFGEGCCLDPRISFVIVSDNQFTSANTGNGSGWHIDKVDKVLGHEMGHALGLSDTSNNPNGLMYNNLKRDDGTPSGIELDEQQIAKIRMNALLINGAINIS
jgi:hypothetical protein